MRSGYNIATPPLAPRCWPVTNEASGEPEKGDRGGDLGRVRGPAHTDDPPGRHP